MRLIEGVVNSYEFQKYIIQNNSLGFYLEPEEFYSHKCEDQFQRKCKKCNIDKIDREILRIKAEYQIT